MPAGTSRSASASIRLFSTAWASVASEQADERAPDGSRWLLHGTAASAWVDRILLAIVAAPCRAALVHAAALSAELALGKWHGMLVAVAPAAARTAPTVDGLCAIVSAARQLSQLRPTPLRLVILTAGALPVAPRAGAKAPATSLSCDGAWGLARVLQLELSALRLTAADVCDEVSLAAAARELLGQRHAGGDEQSLAWRHSARLRGAASARRRRGEQANAIRQDLAHQPLVG